MNSVRIFFRVAICVGVVSLAGCFKPPINMPDASVIHSDGSGAVPPDCSELSSPSLLSDAGWRRPSMQWGCATYTNLAAQVANPRDLDNPGKLGPADAAMAASAVRRYETGRVKALDTTSSRNSQ